MPPAEGRGSGQGKPRKRASRSIRDAAKKAAGSAATPPPSKPAFPDFDTPSSGWDPWDGAEGAAAGGQTGDSDLQRTLGDWFEAVIPPDAQVHFIRAGREFAAGVQTTVDHHLGRRPGAEGGSDGASRIEIE